MAGGPGTGGMEKSRSPFSKERKKDMKVNRELLLNQLVAVVPGASFSEGTTQASFFVFHKDKVFTFNGEVACRVPCCFTGVTVAVPAKPLLQLLSKLKEEFLEFNLKDDEKELHVVGKGKRTKFRIESEVNLELDKIEKPKSWNQMPDEFKDAVDVVSKCAGPKSSEHFEITCIHIDPEYMESTDNYQLIKYPLETGIETSMLIKADTIKKVITLGMTHISETENWLHFKDNRSGLIVSCLISRDDYYPLASIFENAGGKKTTLPKGLENSIENAEIFSSENADNNVITVLLSHGKIEVTGEGSDGEHTERKKITYAGPEMRFLIQPAMLAEVAKRYNVCQISDEFMTVSGGAFTYITCLSKVEEKK